jgi:hypothetical protein
MSFLSIVLFAHVAGMLGLFVTLGLEGVALSRAQELEMPRLYRASLALVVFSGAYLSRGLLQGTAISAWDLGWLAASVPALAGVVAAGAVRGRIRSRAYPVRTAAALAIVFLMVAKPRLDMSMAVVVIAAAAGIVSSVVWRRREIGVRAATEL